MTVIIAIIFNKPFESPPQSMMKTAKNYLVKCYTKCEIWLMENKNGGTKLGNNKQCVFVKFGNLWNMYYVRAFGKIGERERIVSYTLFERLNPISFVLINSLHIPHICIIYWIEFSPIDFLRKYHIRTPLVTITELCVQSWHTCVREIVILHVGYCRQIAYRVKRIFIFFFCVKIRSRKCQADTSTLTDYEIFYVDI